MNITTGMVALAASAIVATSVHAEIIDVTVTVENLAPEFGTFQTPFWLGFHDGGWDTYDTGSAASAGLERLAEDGNAAPLMGEFMASGSNGAQGVLAAGGPFFPGAIASTTFQLDSSNAQHRFFSYASMVIPSNDAFIANGDAMAHSIFDGNGNFLGANFFVTGADVLDAGTEVNDELPMNTAFFGQMSPNTGVAENGLVQQHVGYNGSAGAGGTPSILADPSFAGADFTLDGYPIARITITAVPAPGAMALLGLGGVAGFRRRRRA